MTQLGSSSIPLVPQAHQKIRNNSVHSLITQSLARRGRRDLHLREVYGKIFQTQSLDPVQVLNGRYAAGGLGFGMSARIAFY